MKLISLCVAFGSIALSLPTAVRAEPVVLTMPDGAHLQAEAIDDHILHIWLKPEGNTFTREASLATEAAPTTRVSLTRQTDGPVTTLGTGALTARIDVKTLMIDVCDRDTGIPLLARAHLERPAVPANADSPWSLTFGLDPDEHLLGLGQDNHRNGRLDRRGVVRELWAGQQINSGNVTADYPIPFLLSTGRHGQAYGLFFDNVHRLRFDLGAAKPDQVRLDAAGGEIDFYVIGGPRLTELIERYTRLTGRPSLPPLWALGYWQSKCQYNNWDDIDDAYSQLHARGFPVDVMVIDAGWPEIVTDYVWARRWSAAETGHGRTPGQKVAAYAKEGVKIVMSQSGPMVRSDSPTYPSGWAAGVFATDGKGNPVECGYYGGKLLDFTNPKLGAWLWPQTRKLNEAGVAGWWLDLTEPEGEPPQTRYFGGTPANIHNQYSLRCTLSFEGVQLAVHPDQRPCILTRSGSAGLQRHHAAVWTGDIYSDYATLRAHPPEMLNSGLSGFTWWTCDTGGFLTGYYKDDQFGAHARLYERWMEFSAFSPITRAHKAGGAPEPYQFGPAVEQSTKHYLQLRYRLLPYIYSYAWAASQTGVPLVRPLALQFQDDPRAMATPGDEYLFGGELLVAPVLHEGLANRRVYFPAGIWFDWDTGVEYTGGREWVVAAPQNRIPVAARAGAIIPLAPPMLHTGEKPWDPLTLEIYPAGHSSFTLYQDDGITFGYEKGRFTTTALTCDASATAVDLAINESNKQFTPMTYVARFHLQSTPTGATDEDGKELVQAWSAADRVLTVTLSAAAGATWHGIHVVLGGPPLPPRPAPELVADEIDPKTETDSSAGRPVPHFFPSPTLPGRIKAMNYDKGGEGVAYHLATPAASPSAYRPDNFHLVEGTDAGGGYALGGLQAGEWMRYSIDCGNGGWFDLTARVASLRGGRFRIMALDQIVATVDVPATGGVTAWRDVTVPQVYLNPGEISLMVYVDQPGFWFNSLAFVRSATAPAIYPAVRAARRGVVEIGRGAGPTGGDAIRNLGRIGSSLTWGVFASREGMAALRFVYQSDQAKPLPYALAVDGGPTRPIELKPTAGAWKNCDIALPLTAGAHRVELTGLVDGWDSITVDRLDLIQP